MKKSLLAFMAALIAVPAFAAMPTAAGSQSMSASVDNLTKIMLQNERGLVPTVNKALVPQYNWEGTDTMKYFVGAQSFMNGWQFDPNGGDSRNYEIGVLRDGNRIVFTNLFDSCDPTSWSPNYDFPIEGIYDADAGTITVDCPQVAVSVYGSYLADLKAFSGFDANGNVTDEYALDKLVFNVTGDLKTITAASYFGAQYAWGWTERFKTFTAMKEDPNDPAVVVKVGEDINFGSTYAGMTIEKSFSLLNMGGQAAEYVITIEADDDAFKADKITGEVAPYSSADIMFIFAPQSAGIYEGLATIEIEDHDPILVLMAGEGLAVPDYSAIVKGGDFSFETVVDFPASIAEVQHQLYDENGAPVVDEAGQPVTETVTAALLTAGGQYGMSKIKAKFNVPEGKMGILSFKGHYDNPSNVSWKGASYILYDDENLYASMYQIPGDFPSGDCFREFATGDHYMIIALQDALSHDPGLCAYIWDLNLNIVDPGDNPPVVLNPDQFLGFGIAGNGYVTEKITTIEVQNKSNKTMKIESISCDNDEFDYSVPSLEVGLLEKIIIPVEMIAETAGDNVANYTIVTNLGTVTAKVSAKTCEYPDYTVLVTEGAEYFNFEVNKDYPFTVVDGVAYNLTSQVPDAEQTYSSMRFTVDVPEDCIAQLHFTGHSWGTPTEMYAQTSYWDFGGIQCAYPERFNNINGFTAAFYDNDVEVSENYWAEIGDGDFTEYTVLPAGQNNIEFFYQQGGDNSWYGNDRFEVRSIGVTVKSTGIIDVASDLVVSKEYYTLSGIRVDNPDKGLYIERTVYGDGRIDARKVHRK